MLQVRLAAHFQGSDHVVQALGAVQLAQAQAGGDNPATDRQHACLNRGISTWSLDSPGVLPSDLPRVLPRSQRQRRLRVGTICAGKEPSRKRFCCMSGKIATLSTCQASTACGAIMQHVHSACT